jgi:hypothetical protein
MMMVMVVVVLVAVGEVVGDMNVLLIMVSEDTVREGRGMVMKRAVPLVVGMGIVVGGGRGGREENVILNVNAKGSGRGRGKGREKEMMEWRRLRR